MLNLLKNILKMPYHIRKKVLNRFYSVIMYSFLVITLFPIVWMIYTSFMSNNDIIQGKIVYQRAPYNVLLTKTSGQQVLVATSDGSLSRYDLKKKKLIYRKNFKTSQTNFKYSKKYIWLSSADHGLVRIKTDKIKSAKKVDVVWNETPLDFNKISKTLIALDEKNNRLWLSIGYQDYDRIFEYDTESLKLVNTYRILPAFPYSFEKLAISDLVFAADYLYAATNRGIAKINLKNKNVEKVIENQDFSVAEIKTSVFAEPEKTVYFASTNSLYTLKLTEDNLKQVYSTLSLPSIEQISTITLADKNIILGTGHGYLVVDKKGKLLEEVTLPIFNDIDEKGHLVRKGTYVSSEVTSTEYVGKDLAVFGTSAGRVTLLDLKDKIVESTGLIDKKSYVKFYWRNYIDLFHNINFGLFLKNSFFICGITALISMLLATITAYALVRFPFPGNRAISTAILSTQMIPGVMTLIPIYIMFIKFTQVTGIPLKGTYAGMIFVYSAFFLPFSIWILRGFFASIPVSLEEAATIDGCSPFQVFWRIALPLSIPGIVATGIFIFLVAWDELVFAWVLSNAQTMTIPVGIRLFVGNFQNRYDLLMAASTIATIPVLIMFILLQKQIVSGLTAGAVKQ